MVLPRCVSGVEWHRGLSGRRGFTTTSYGPWPAFGILVLLVLMLIGGGACSTAGGIKQYRIYLLLKALVWQVRRAFLPHWAVVENYVWQGDRKDFIDDRRIRDVATFVSLFLLTYMAGAGVLAALRIVQGYLDDLPTSAAPGLAGPRRSG